MFLVDHKANKRLALAVGNAPDRLAIDITAHFHHYNALLSGGPAPSWIPSILRSDEISRNTRDAQHRS